MKPLDYTKLPTMHAAQIEKRWRIENDEWDRLLSRMIENGRGRELPTETLKRAEGPDPDSLSCEYARNFYRRQAISAERQARLRYHNSLKPMPNH